MNKEARKKAGRPRKYSADKANCTIGLTPLEKEAVKNKYATIQEFIEDSLRKMYIEGLKKA